MKSKYGWLADIPDRRDHKFKYFHKVFGDNELPSAVDLRQACRPAYDQGNLGSCSANAIAGAVLFDMDKQGLPQIDLARLFIYYNERAMEGSIYSDSGAQIRDGIKSINEKGVCTESLCPYDVTKFAICPSAEAYAEALDNIALAYTRLDNTDINELKSCLVRGFPFVLGITVYESFESQEVAQSGIVPMPGQNESVQGGHAVLCVGYDDATSTFLVRNSWGPTWGQSGYFTIPYAYLTDADLADDFWMVTQVK